MKSQFNSKMSNSPFYVGPAVYVKGDDGWSFASKKDSSIYKFITVFTAVSIVLYFIFL